MADEQKENKKIVDRSPAYPSIDLKSAVDLAAKLFDLFSEYPFTREVATEKLGIGKNSANFRKIAALVQYGLLKREGGSYKITDLAKNIVLSTDEPAKIKGLQKAVLGPKIFSELIRENKGRGLPASLDTILRQHDYSKKAAKNLALIFRHSLDYSVLLKNGIVADPAAESGQGNESGFEEKPPDQRLTPQHIPQGPKSDVSSPHQNSGADLNNYIQYPLDCGIIVKFPISMVKKLASGIFLEKLEELEKLGREDANGTPADNASDTPVEPD